MRKATSEHRKLPWRVHSLVSDFELDEVWEFPILADVRKAETFRVFCQLEDQGVHEPLPVFAELLVRMRQWLGSHGLDKAVNALPIPGTNQYSLRERCNETAHVLPDRDARFPFRVVYDLENERLVELSNSTVHVAVHLGWAHQRDTFYSPVMAVYVKPRGNFGMIYMKLIYPFRVAIVYPAIMKAAKRRWEKMKRQRDRAIPEQ